MADETAVVAAPCGTGSWLARGARTGPELLRSGSERRRNLAFARATVTQRGAASPRPRRALKRQDDGGIAQAFALGCVPGVVDERIAQAVLLPVVGIC